MADTTTELVIGEIRAVMGRRRLTQTALAELVGENQAWLSRRLSGGTPIDLGDLTRIADALGVPISDLIAAAA